MRGGHASQGHPGAPLVPVPAYGCVGLWGEVACLRKSLDASWIGKIATCLSLPKVNGDRSKPLRVSVFLCQLLTDYAEELAVTGVRVEHHRGPALRQRVGQSHRPWARTLDVVPRSMMPRIGCSNRLIDRLWRSLRRRTRCGRLAIVS